MAFDTFSRGKQLCYEGDLTSGLELISKALRLRPRDPNFLSMKAFFLSEKKQFKDSIQEAEKALRIKSKDIRANDVVFYSSLITGNTEKCKAHLSKMKRYQCPRQGKAMMKISEKTNQLKEYCAIRDSLEGLLESNIPEEVIRKAEKCLRVGTYDTTVLYFKMEALFLQGRYKAVCNTYNGVRPIASEMSSFSKLTEVHHRALIIQGKGAFEQKNSSRSGVMDCIERVVKTVDDFIDKKNYSTAAAIIEDIIQIMRKAEAPGKPLHKFPLTIWERRLEDVKEAVRVKGNPSTWTLTRALRALKANGKERELVVECNRKFRIQSLRYHPDKHTDESQCWLDMYNMLVQEVRQARDYIEKNGRKSDIPIQTNIPTGFRWTPNQMKFMEMDRAAKQRKSSV